MFVGAFHWKTCFLPGEKKTHFSFSDFFLINRFPSSALFEETMSEMSIE